jgi:hypothetical protein
MSKRTEFENANFGSKTTTTEDYCGTKTATTEDWNCGTKTTTSED